MVNGLINTSSIPAPQVATGKQGTMLHTNRSEKPRVTQISNADTTNSLDSPTATAITNGFYQQQLQNFDLNREQGGTDRILHRAVITESGSGQRAELRRAMFYDLWVLTCFHIKRFATSPCKTKLQEILPGLVQ